MLGPYRIPCYSPHILGPHSLYAARICFKLLRPLNVQAYLEQPLGYEPLMQAQRPFEVLEPKEPREPKETKDRKEAKERKEQKEHRGFRV